MTGIIVMNKPQGITSFKLVSMVKRITGEKKCGHTGTLDPMATGVMTVMLGGATRFCELLPDHDKAYRAKVMLGTVTDTLDITGKVVDTCEVNVTRQQFETALSSFEGEITQLPPMYSAVSVDGRRLYDLARKGIEVERRERRATVYSARFIAQGERPEEYVIDVSCSAGTYIRTLADDLGRQLGCGATLSALCRTRANGFSLEQALTPEQLEQAVQSGQIGSCLRSVDSALTVYPGVTVTEPQAVRFSNGGELDRGRLDCPEGSGLCRVYSPGGDFLGLGELEEKQMTVKRVYVEK